MAALNYLRQATFPQLVDPPRFLPRTRSLASRPEWLTRLLRTLSRPALIAGAIAALVLVLATALPTWAALQPAGSAPASAPMVVHSSAGTTSTATTHVDNLSAATFVGQIPFIQRARYLDARAGATPAPLQFVQGARQAELFTYVQDVTEQVAFPYLHNAVETKRNLDAWNAAAAAEAMRQAAEREAAQAQAAAPPASATYWQGSLAEGTRIPGATVTFYACVGNGFCGNMASGQPVFEGAAACSYDLPFGTQFVIAGDPSQRVFTCLDRGALSPTWVDVWFYDAADGYAWQSLVGSYSDIIIVG